MFTAHCAPPVNMSWHAELTLNNIAFGRLVLVITVFTDTTDKW